MIAGETEIEVRQQEKREKTETTLEGYQLRSAEWRWTESQEGTAERFDVNG